MQRVMFHGTYSKKTSEAHSRLPLLRERIVHIHSLLDALASDSRAVVRPWQCDRHYLTALAVVVDAGCIGLWLVPVVFLSPCQHFSLGTVSPLQSHDLPPSVCLAVGSCVRFDSSDLKFVCCFSLLFCHSFRAVLLRWEVVPLKSSVRVVPVCNIRRATQKTKKNNRDER